MPQALSCMTLDIRNAIIKILKDDTYIGSIILDGSEKIIRTISLKDRIINKYPAISVYNNGCNYDSEINSIYHETNEEFIIQVATKAFYSNSNDSRYCENARDDALLLCQSIKQTLSPKRTLDMPINTINGFRFKELIPMEHEFESNWYYIIMLTLDVSYQENLVSEELFL